ncbi:MAG: hypothetical protein FE78DRAFT_326321 [Acidomyces sp. 'richmondensis']|nr:MAG: hypothetical protein FE78DRAFT_326321 [Acidomyces sp. 'richmondensis']
METLMECLEHLMGGLMEYLKGWLSNGTFSARFDGIFDARFDGIFDAGCDGTSNVRCDGTSDARCDGTSELGRFGGASHRTVNSRLLIYLLLQTHVPSHDGLHTPWMDKRTNQLLMMLKFGRLFRVRWKREHKQHVECIIGTNVD